MDMAQVLNDGRVKPTRSSYEVTMPDGVWDVIPHPDSTAVVLPPNDHPKGFKGPDSHAAYLAWRAQAPTYPSVVGALRAVLEGTVYA